MSLFTANPKYWLYGLSMIGLAGYQEYRGVSFASINETKVPPKSIRDNPGAYRSSYSGFPRYFGGK
ncbi:MAG: hypothetical protein K2Q23_11520 [Bryobacteraceae bacterium]|nr:hypothetical protein [Bryobacteraceae bacterium]